MEPDFTGGNGAGVAGETRKRIKKKKKNGSRALLIPTEIEMTDREEKKLKLILNEKKNRISIRATLCPGSKKILLLTAAQIEKLKQGKRFMMRSLQLSKNKSFSGGFLVSLISALVAGISTALVEHAVSGGGMFLSKGRRVPDPLTRGHGLFLNKRSGGKHHTLYLRRNDHLVKVQPHSHNDAVTLIPLNSDIEKRDTDRFSGQGLFLVDRRSENIYVPTEAGIDGVYKILV